MDNVIKNKCQTKFFIDLNKFVELQGNLKESTEDELLKLETSIIKYGIISPFFAWLNEDKYWIIDAHRRLIVLNRLKEKGFKIPKIPTVLIEASSRIEAKEILLLYNSKYGRMTYEGLSDFLSELNFEINIDDLKSVLDFPDINIDFLDFGSDQNNLNSFFNDESDDNSSEDDLKKLTLKYTEEEYNKVIEGLNKIDKSPEKAILSLLEI